MAAITPPPIRVELLRVPQSLSGEGEMDFNLWFGPLPIHWSALIEAASDTGFTDRQLKGPFATWEHCHSFVAVDDRTTEVIDQVSLRLKPHLLWGAFGLLFVLGLPAFFGYRAWKTRRLLGKELS